MEKKEIKKTMEKNQLLKGKVIFEREVPGKDGIKDREIVVDCSGTTVFIKEEDCKKFPFAKTIISLIGEEIEFVLISADYENEVYYGSMKEAEEVKLKPIIENIEKGGVVNAVVVNTTVHGAYLYINGVHGFLKNMDFSNDGSSVRDYYSRLDSIKVKFLRYAKSGEMLFEAAEKKTAATIVKMDEIKAGNIFRGKVTGSYPDRIYVNIAPGCDLICDVPKNVYKVYTEDTVLIKVTKVYKDNKDKTRLRGVILNKDYKTLNQQEIDKIREAKEKAKEKAAKEKEIKETKAKEGQKKEDDDNEQ